MWRICDGGVNGVGDFRRLLLWSYLYCLGLNRLRLISNGLWRICDGGVNGVGDFHRLLLWNCLCSLGLGRGLREIRLYACWELVLILWVLYHGEAVQAHLVGELCIRGDYGDVDPEGPLLHLYVHGRLLHPRQGRVPGLGDVSLDDLLVSPPVAP